MLGAYSPRGREGEKGRLWLESDFIYICLSFVLIYTFIPSKITPEPLIPAVQNPY